MNGLFEQPQLPAQDVDLPLLRVGQHGARLCADDGKKQPPLFQDQFSRALPVGELEECIGSARMAQV